MSQALLRQNSLMQPNCTVCQQVGKYKCSNCKQAYYCSIQHQKEDWPQHKPTCTTHTQTMQKSTLSLNNPSTGNVPTSVDDNGRTQIDVDKIYKIYDDIIAANQLPSITEKSKETQNIERVATKIPGLQILNNYLTPSEHNMLLELALEERENASRGNDGSKYDHMVATMQFIPSVDMYIIYKAIFQRMIKDQLVTHAPAQLTINYYEPHEGLCPHTDNPKCIKELVVGFSLGSPCVMTFTHTKTNEKMEYVLNPSSVMIQQGEVRYHWKHGIEPTMIHHVQGTNEIIKRGYRVSIQFSDFVSGFFSNPEIQSMMIKSVNV